MGDPGVDRQHLSFISSCHTTKLHTLSFPTFCLTRSFQDFLDPGNCIDPHDWIVSSLLTFFLRSSSFKYKEREERFSQHYPLHFNPDASLYPMNPFQCMVTVGHNARVFVSNRRPTEQEETAKQRSEGNMERNVWY